MTPSRLLAAGRVRRSASGWTALLLTPAGVRTAEAPTRARALLAVLASAEVGYGR